jgi:hypothetical protein
MLQAIRPRQIAALLGLLLLALVVYGGIRLSRALAQISAGVTPVVTISPGPAGTPTLDSAWPTPTLTPALPATGTPTPSLSDPYEPDEQVPAPISIGEVQTRTFDPAGDVDRVSFRVKAGRLYLVTTSNLAIGVDTRLEVQVDGQLLVNDDQSPGTLASQVLFTASADGLVSATIYNQDQYGPQRSYDVSVVVVEPTLTPTLTLTVPVEQATPSPRQTRPAGTGSPSPTWTLRPSLTVTPSRTRTPLATRSVTPTRTQTRTLTLTPTRTVSPTATLSRTPTLSPTITPTRTVTGTPSPARTLPPVRTPWPGR